VGPGRAPPRGRLRLNGRAVDKSAAPVRAGDILTFATHGGGVRVIRVTTLPARRGPAPEAQGCYEELAIANVSQQDAAD
jgi:ribosome-associated heat shock protein Hsp15